MQLTKINPFIRYAAIHTCYRPVSQNCVCYDCRVFYVTEGEGTFHANGESYTLSGYTFIFLPPLTRYRFLFRDPSAVRICVLNFDLCDTFDDHKKSLGTATEDSFDEKKALHYPLPSCFRDVIVQPGMMQLGSYMQKCVEAFTEKDAYYEAVASAHVKLCLFDALAGAAQEAAGQPLVAAVRAYIRENYADALLTNDAIAAQFHYHPYHISRLMKAVTGKTLHSYLLEYRIQAAKNYLLTTDYSVGTIAEKTGFSSYAYFISRFHAQTGASPQQYRKAHKHIGF